MLLCPVVESRGLRGSHIGLVEYFMDAASIEIKQSSFTFVNAIRPYLRPMLSPYKKES